MESEGKIMLRQIISVVLLAVLIAVPATSAQNIARGHNNDDYQYQDRARIDRYLDAEIWTNHNDGEYYEDDNIVIHFRVNRDAFVVIYSIDTRGRVNMLLPGNPSQDNFIKGGTTYHLPNRSDDYDLVVTGPEGVENIQIVASRERIPIPEWYPVSGIECDWDDRLEFMNYLNDRYFVSYNGQRLTYDRTSIYVNEWEEYYFQPVYRPVYHNWTMCGNVYIDYPFGSSVYVNGVYWGCTPLYIPRVYVGWHTLTVYDRWGYCWESDIHISRYHSVVLNHEVIRTKPSVQSKFKKVRTAGYRNPESHGYPKFTKKKTAILNSKTVTKKNIVLSKGRFGKSTNETVVVAPKKNVRGSTSLVKTKRGWETTGRIGSSGTKGWNREKSIRRSVSAGGSGEKEKREAYRSKERSSKIYRDYNSNKSSSRSKSTIRKSVINKDKSSGYYQKKSNENHYKSNDSKNNKSKSKSYNKRTPKQSSGSIKSSKSSGKSSKSTISKSKSSGSKGKERR